MIYGIDITTPMNTPLISARQTLLRVTKGLVYKIELYFPSGAAGSHHVSLWDGSFQVWPSSSHTWFRGDDTLISFDDTYLKLAPPFEFNVVTFNLSSNHDHEVMVRIGLVSSSVFMARFLPTFGFDYLVKLLKEEQVKQEVKLTQDVGTPFPWLIDV